MDDLSRALHDISSIRRQVANSTEFRGYGPAMSAATAMLALVAGTVQYVCVPDPARHFSAYLTIWISTAVLSATLTGIQMYTRARRMHSGLSDEMIQMAVEQFIPSAVGGLLLTVVMVGSVPHSVWMLPGLWQILCSIGIISSCRFLPKPMLVPGLWYLVTGLGCIALDGQGALAPVTMALPFAIGQILVALVLRFYSSPADDHEI